MAAAPLFPHMLPILRGDGSPVQDFRSAADWRSLKDGTPDGSRADAEPITTQSFLAEEHHRAYGRPWIMGRYYVDQLISLGVRPGERVLDLGCGAGRVGIWLIPVLEPERYCGVDNHLRSLVAFAGYENVLHRLWPRRPRLMLSDAFEVEGFGQRFDVVLDLFVLAHLDEAVQRTVLRRIAGVCAPKARLITLQPPADSLDAMAALGFALTEEHQVAYPLLEGAENPKHVSDHWRVFERVIN